MFDFLPTLVRSLDPRTVLFPLLVVLTGFLLLLLTQRALLQAKEWRLRRLKRREIEDPVPPAAEGDHEAPTIEEVAEQSIRDQFTVTRMLVRPLILGLTFLLALLPFLDRIPAAAVSMIVGGTTVILGIAARPVVENAIAGLVISYSRTLNLGDTVKLHGHYGTVEDIGLTHTTIRIWDYRRYVLPNAKMISSEFLNYSLVDRWVWASVEFWVEPEADLEKVEQLAREACVSSEALALREEEPAFWVMEMGKEGLRCWIAGWAATPPDAWTLASDTRRGLIRSFQAEGIRSHTYRHEIGGPGNGEPPGRGPGGSGSWTGR